MRLAANSKPWARVCLFIWSQRKLFLLVFLWTGLCLLVLNSGGQRRDTFAESADLELESDAAGHRHHQQARSAASLRPPLASAPPPPPPPVQQPVKLWPQSKGTAEEKLQESKLQDKKVSQPVVELESGVNAPKSTTSGENNNNNNKQRQASEKFVENVQLNECHYDYPNLFDLQFNNIHWQKFTSSAREFNLTSDNLKPATFYLYNAYYDDRWRAGQPSIRVLAMIDRIHPPPTDCLLWSSQLTYNQNNNNNQNKAALRPIVTRAHFVYAWYPKWGNYEDGLLQPWIVTCPVPREHTGLVPDSVSLVDAPLEMSDDEVPENENQLADEENLLLERGKRDLGPELGVASVPLPPSYSSSSSSSASSNEPSPSQRAQSPASHSTASNAGSSSNGGAESAANPRQRHLLDCNSIQRPISNNLPVFNRRPQAGQSREKFAVCVKGLDFPQDSEHVSVRLVEWFELLNLLGAKKIFLYNLNVHENISKVLHHYQQRGFVELTPLTLPGDQPNLPEYQHLYLKQKLTSKRQNELLPYNDCLYRNLYSYEYLALLDIDEIIMPLKRQHNNWYDLMEEVERVSLAEQNYSRASYNVRNVYFFDDLSGPLGTTPTSRGGLLGGAETSSQASAQSADDQLVQGGAEVDKPQQHRDSAERGIPHYLHMMSHVYRSKNYTEPGQYVKCFHNTERVISLHNHFPMNCFGQCTTYSVPVDLAHLQHYRKDCVGPLKQSCKNDFRLFTTRDTTIWKYKERMIKRTTRALNRLGLLANYSNNQKVLGQ